MRRSFKIPALAEDERPGTARPVSGRGRSFGSFGEIVQGRLSDGQDFLVTLPIDMWSSCELDCAPRPGRTTVHCALSKSRRVAEQMLEVLGIESGFELRLTLTRDIPVGKGLSSSTADMLAVVRAFERAFGVTVTPEFISRLFTEIEPHDGLHYPTCVVYDHRRGQLLARFGHVPSFSIVGVDAGGENPTTEYNAKLDFPPSYLSRYDELHGELCAAFADRDDARIAACAQRSTRLHASRTHVPLLSALLERSPQLGVLGILTAHSGTCAGLLLPADASDARLREVEASVSDYGRVFRTRTLKRPS